jgi:hypothetical protein
MLSQIVIEAETPGDLRTMFRLRIDASVIAEDLTEVQAELLVGEILERIALPRSVAGPAPGGLLAVLMRIVAGPRSDDVRLFTRRVAFRLARWSR